MNAPLVESKNMYLEETDNGDLVVFNELLGRVDIRESDSWRSGLLLNPVDDGLGGAAAVVFNGLAVAAKEN